MWRLARLAGVALTRSRVSTLRPISTSGGNKDATQVPGVYPTAPGPVTAKDFEEAPTKNKNWISYGFDFHDREKDENVMNTVFFFTISILIVVGAALYTYKPDTTLRDWAQREAYLELRRREAAGLEPIDPFYIDPATITLPTEEELAGVEIVI